MIEIDLGTAVMLYSTVLGVLIAGIWIYTELSIRRPQRHLGTQFLWRCIICGLSYLDEEATSLSQCPRCGSFNRPEEARQSGTVTLESVESSETNAPRPRRSGSKGKRRGQRHRGGRKRR